MGGKLNAINHHQAGFSMIRRTSEQWLALFDQHKSSGLTQTEFAKQQGIVAFRV